MDEVTTLMQRGLAAGDHDEWYDDRRCVDVVKNDLRKSNKQYGIPISNYIISYSEGHTC